MVGGGGAREGNALDLERVFQRLLDHRTELRVDDVAQGALLTVLGGGRGGGGNWNIGHIGLGSGACAGEAGSRGREGADAWRQRIGREASWIL